MTDYATEAAVELERAEVWANKDSCGVEFRETMVKRCMDRALIYALLSISQQISLFPNPR